MFKIGEFSKLTQVSIRMLRYYDETGLLKPSQIDPWTGYRMYDASQIPALNKIKYLRDSGFQVSEIAAALNQKEERFIIEHLEKKQMEIVKNIQAEKEKLRKIALAKSEVLHGKSEMYYNISIKSIPAYQVLSLRRIAETYYAEAQLWQDLSSFAEETHAAVLNDTFSVYHDTDYKEKNVDIELCTVVKKMGNNAGNFTYRVVEPVPLMASAMVYGDFSNIAGGYLAFASWLQKNSQYEMTGPTRQIVHCGPWNEENPDKYLTEIQIPLKKGLPDIL